jgi:hypothetical protein
MKMRSGLAGCRPKLGHSQQFLKRAMYHSVRERLPLIGDEEAVMIGSEPTATPEISL